MNAKRNDLSAAMGRRKTATAGQDEPTDVEEVVARANRTAGKPYPRRVALDLNDDQLRDLRLAAVDDGIPITTRARALVTLWRDDAELQVRAAEAARRDVASRHHGK